MHFLAFNSWPITTRISLFVLAKVLESGRPVALCLDTRFFIIFDSDSLKRFKYGDVPDDHLPPYTLALCDFNSTLSLPLYPFVSPSSTSFIVQAASPKIAWWHEWSNKRTLKFGRWIFGAPALKALWTGNSLSILKLRYAIFQLCRIGSSQSARRRHCST